MTVEVIEAFIESRRAVRLSRSYEESIRYLTGFLARACWALPATPGEVEAVLGRLTGLSEVTRRDVDAAFRMLYGWAAERYGVVDVMRQVRRPPRPRRRLPRYLSEEDVERVLWANRRRPRDYAMLRVLLDTGCRVGELAALRWQDLSRRVDGEGGERWCLRLPYEGKTGERQVPIGAETAAALRALPGDPLWASRDGGALTRSGLQLAVRRALARGGVEGRPHLLRHTFARLYLLNGGDLASLQRMLGHAQMSTTAIYLELDVREVERQHARYAPLAVLERREVRDVEREVGGG